MFLFQSPSISPLSRKHGEVEIFWGKAGECGKILITLQIKTFGPLPLLASATFGFLLGLEPLAFRRSFDWALPVLWKGGLWLSAALLGGLLPGLWVAVLELGGEFF